MPNNSGAHALVTVVTVGLFLSALAWAARGEPQPFVNRISVDGTINPAVAEFIHQSI
jgi:hypothetical protein